MDELDGLLDGPRAREAFLLRAEFDPPWSIRVEDRAPLTLVVVLRGEALLVRDEAHHLGAGDVAVVSGPAPYTVSDVDGTEPRIWVRPGQECVDPDGRLLDEALAQGVRTWGNVRSGETSMLIGTYLAEGEVSRRLLGALPGVAVLPRGDSDEALTALLAREMRHDGPGQASVLDRLLDLVLVASLRAWLERGEARGWYAARRDAPVQDALRLVQREPARPWTVASLAAEVGLSRAAFARRFAAVVGEAPMAYLTRWRLDLAADLLAGSDLTVDAVARQVGYANAFALSAAFKRVRGVSPREHRLRARAADSAAVLTR